MKILSKFKKEPHRCFRCGNDINKKENYRFTMEFDAYICENCANDIINNTHDNSDEESQIIREEWT